MPLLKPMPGLLESLREHWGKSAVIRDELGSLIIDSHSESLIDEIVGYLNKRKEIRDKMLKRGVKVGRTMIVIPPADEIRRRRDKGISLKGLAKEYGVSRQTVRNRLKDE